MAKKKKASPKKADKSSKSKVKESFNFNSTVEPIKKKNTPIGPPKTGKLQSEIEEEMEEFTRGIL